MDQREYFSECQSIAQEIVKECDGDRDAAYDALHERIDGHEYIIDTHKALMVLVHSQHDNQLFEELGSTEFDDSTSAFTKMAYFAMHADVLEYLDPLLDEMDNDND